MSTLEWFTVLFYSRSFNALTVHECRKELFYQHRAINNIPLTGAALWKYGLTAAYYAGHMWNQSLMAIELLPPPEKWGWNYDSGKLIPHCADLLEVSSAVSDLIKCRGNPEKGSHWRWKCVNALLPCNELRMCKARDVWARWLKSMNTISNRANCTFRKASISVVALYVLHCHFERNRSIIFPF